MSESTNEMKFSEKAQLFLTNLTQKVQSNIYISAITEGMMGAMGVLIGGSIVNLLVNLPIPGWADVLRSIGIYDLLTVSVKIFQLTSVIMCFLIGYALAGKKDVDKLQAGVISMMCFLLTVPLTVTEGGADAIDITYLNAQNILTSIVTALIATALFAYITKKDIILRMPDAVPPFVKKSFAAMPAGLITIIPFIAIRGILANTSFGTFPDLINTLIATPLQNLGNNLPGHMTFLALSSLSWWFGIHNMPILIVASIILGPSATENVNAVMSGQAAPNMLSWLSFLIPLQFIGGSGSMFGLYIDTILFAKSERYKAQGKVQLVPGLFNITEPAMFGMPTILNPTFLLPTVLTPQVIMLMLYFALKIGIVTTPVVSLSNFLPGPLIGFFMGGGIMMPVFIILCCLVSCVIYYPFVKVADKAECENEAKMASAE